MPGKENDVRSDYVNVSETSAERLLPAPKADAGAEMKRYGTGKPVRLVIRARITSDKS